MDMAARDYITSFIHPADPYDYCWETFRLPRLKDYDRRATRHAEYSVKSLHEYPFQTRFQRSETDKFKKWLLCSYWYDAVVDWIRFDLDRHGYEDIETPDEYADAEHEFYLEVQKLEEIAEEQGFDILWTTSPGNIVETGFCAGEHIQGLYAWIFFDRPISVMDLVGWTRALKEYHDIESECSWDTVSQLIRMPGQRHVELCNPYNGKPQYAYDDSKPDAPLHQFNHAMQSVVPAKVDVFFGEPLKWQKDRNLAKDLGLDSTPATPVHSIPRQHRKAKWDTADDYVADLRSNPDTWDRLWRKDHTAQLLALKYNGDKMSIDKAVAEFEVRACAVSPAESKTVSDPVSRNQFAQRLVTYAFSRFDPKKTGGRRRAFDVERFSYCSKLDRATFRWFVNGLLQVEEEDLDRVMAFFDYVQDHEGRVYYEVCHSIFSGKRNWDRMQEVMRSKGILVTLDEYVRDDKCRQYGWGVKVLQECKKEEKEEADSGSYTPSPLSPPVSVSCSLTPPFSSPPHLNRRVEDSTGAEKAWLEHELTSEGTRTL